MQQVRLSSTGSVLKQGIASLGRDSATVLVVVDAEATSRLRKSLRHFRWEVDLVKVGERWLVDDFAPVLDPAAEAVPQP